MLRRGRVRAAVGACVSPSMVWSLPRKGDITMIETQVLTTSDGESLAMQLWLPATANERPAPVVLEAIPYRKRDRYRAYDMFWGAALASRGIGYARLDTRGSGDSTGLLRDEYLPRQHADCAEAIAWLADQDWSNGAVGMRGVSWGGFSTLQTAALAPPALKAIMPMCASDMRFTDDAHYIGGAVALTGLKWATSMKLVMAGPPDPLVMGAAWERIWRERLEACPPIAAQWLEHQTNDAYWQQGSVGLDWNAIVCPAYVVGGLVDPYQNLIPRLLANLKGPRKGIYGPWRHGYPLPALPGPALDWVFEEVRWWCHWLMQEETGIMGEPMLRVYMPDATAAQVAPGPLPGRWVAETSWPASTVEERRLRLGPAVLSEGDVEPGTITISGADLVGLGMVEWVPFACSELPLEQSPDDSRSAVFDGQPLSEPLEVLGSPALTLSVACDRPIAHLAARLCEVTAEGQSWLITYGLLNLTHRDGHEHPHPLTPGETYQLVIPLNFTAHRFAAGSRLRLALSESLWPLVWPAPQVATLTLDLATASLSVPIRTAPQREADMPIAEVSSVRDNPDAWPIMDISETKGTARVAETWPESSTLIAEIGETILGSGPNIGLTQTSGDPLSCAWRADQTAGFHRPGWDVRLRATVVMTADRTHFRIRERTRAWLNGDEVIDKAHEADVPRVLL